MNSHTYYSNSSFGTHTHTHTHTHVHDALTLGCRSSRTEAMRIPRCFLPQALRRRRLKVRHSLIHCQVIKHRIKDSGLIDNAWQQHRRHHRWHTISAVRHGFSNVTLPYASLHGSGIKLLAASITSSSDEISVDHKIGSWTGEMRRVTPSSNWTVSTCTSRSHGYRTRGESRALLV